MNEQIKEFLKTHWLGMLFGLIPSTLVFIFTLINIFVTFRVDYLNLKTTVEADTSTLQIIGQNLQSGQTSQNKVIDALIQSQLDQGKQIDVIQSQVDDIHNYFFTKK